MDTTRNDYSHVRSQVNDEDRTFKKAYQVVDRPQVTDHDIHEDYLKSPPNNQPTEPTSDRKARGLKEGAQEVVDPKQEGVLGDEPISKITKELELGTTTNENSVHRNV